MDLVIVGSIGYDDLETPEASGSDIIGGSAVHSSISAVFHLPKIPGLPPRVGIIGPVGEDFQNQDLGMLESKGLDITGITKMKGKTFRWSGKYEGAMENAQTISTEVNVLADFEPIIPEYWDNPEILFCANMHPLSQISVLEQSTNVKISVLDTFMLWIDTELETLSDALRKVDIAILNEEEVCAIAKENILTKAAEKIISGEALHGGKAAGDGPRGLIIKRGSSGVLAYMPCGIIVLPSYPTKDIVDPTGCGDSFAGAFLSNMIGSGNMMEDREVLRNALVQATVTASFTIGGLGSTNLINLQRGVYHARVDDYRRMVGLQ
ncbi:MAG: PfkB family carbohydrate kinase [Candidatus Poseidoniales archaeon]|mgnify:CR=1 FL=1|jgi:sugar/nucleoside kinase (ribokinase family)|tara:strand:- start:240 stop:1205 length:966 start_codon:yes stop_codon:yes gene_type:complete